MGEYVFRVRFELDSAPDVSVDTAAFETVVRRATLDPGEESWPFFEAWLWRGKLTDERRFRREMESWLGVPVLAVSFSELRVTATEREALEDAVAADFQRFDADSVREVLHRHLGSSIRVVAEEQDT